MLPDEVGSCATADLRGKKSVLGGKKRKGSVFRNELKLSITAHIMSLSFMVTEKSNPTG